MKIKVKLQKIYKLIEKNKKNQQKFRVIFKLNKIIWKKIFNQQINL